jgi:thiol-disulfide isomerase/thioredoxin
MVLLVLVPALLAVACGREVPAPTGDPQSATLLPEDRLALPELDLAQFQALLDELRGTPVVVNVWGSWCAPCAAEAPELAEVAREFEGRVQFIGLDILDSRPAARQFILAADWPYPSVFDPKGAIRDGLGYIGQPVTVIYDAEGRKVFEWTGAVTAPLLRKEIRKVL